MWYYRFLVTLFIFICFILIAVILVQKSKSSMGLGALGGGTQMLFGGSGGQDLFQKITWVLGTIFMIGSLLLMLMKATQERTVTFTPSGRVAASRMGMPIAQAPEISRKQSGFPGMPIRNEPGQSTPAEQAKNDSVEKTSDVPTPNNTPTT